MRLESVNVDRIARESLWNRFTIPIMSRNFANDLARVEFGYGETVPRFLVVGCSNGIWADCTKQTVNYNYEAYRNHGERECKPRRIGAKSARGNERSISTDSPLLFCCPRVIQPWPRTKGDTGRARVLLE